MKVSIIIINFNTFQLTRNCIHSVVEQTRGVEYEIILVDNNSSECDPENFSKDFPSVILIKNKINAGFAGGNNLGIQIAKGQYVLLLDSDTYLKEDTISKSIAYMEQYPLAGVPECRMTFADGAVQHTARHFKIISCELLNIFRFIPMLMPYNKRSKFDAGKIFSVQCGYVCSQVGGR